MAVLPALLLSLALLPQDPTSQAPISAGQAEAATTPATAQAEGPVPRGAPSDDYGLVNWCWGALSGHMAVYPRVRDQLPVDGYALDEQQMAAGREYLALYERAVATSNAASPTSRERAAESARNAGAGVWAPAANLSPVDLKWAYLGWSLPGRCETAARRLLSNAELLAPALRTNSVAIGPGGSAPTAGAPGAVSSGGALPSSAEPVTPTPAAPEPTQTTPPGR